MIFNQKSVFLIIIGAALYVYINRPEVVGYGNSRVNAVPNADRRTLAYKNS
jgi:hypothetical protein